MGFRSRISFNVAPRHSLPGVQFLAVQQVLLRNYGRVIGGLEIAALFSTLAMAISRMGGARGAPPCDPCLRLCPAHSDYLDRVD